MANGNKEVPHVDDVACSPYQHSTLVRVDHGNCGYNNKHTRRHVIKIRERKKAMKKVKVNTIFQANFIYTSPRYNIYIIKALQNSKKERNKKNNKIHRKCKQENPARCEHFDSVFDEVLRDGKHHFPKPNI